MIRTVYLSFLAGAAILAACAPSGPTLIVENVRGRVSPMMAASGAFYMTLRNAGGEADALVGACSDACGVIELHETVVNEDGTMGMRPVEGQTTEVPAGATVELEPGGLHMMCLQKTVE